MLLGDYIGGDKHRTMGLVNVVKELDARAHLPYSIDSHSSLVRKFQRRMFLSGTSSNKILFRGAACNFLRSPTSKQNLDFIIAHGTFTGKTIQRDILKNREVCVSYLIELIKKTHEFSGNEKLFEGTEEKRALAIATYFEALRIRGYPDVAGFYSRSCSELYQPLCPGRDMRAVALGYSNNPVLASKYVELAEGSIRVREKEEPISLKIAEHVVVKGDGACYYRALYIGSIESYILSEDRVSLFSDLVTEFNKVIASVKNVGEGKKHLKLISFLKDFSRI